MSINRHDSKPQSTDPVERTFDNVSRLLGRICHQRWNHRALGRLNERGAYHDDDDEEATSGGDER